MDEKILGYLVVGAIYVISRLMKKKKPATNKPSAGNAPSKTAPKSLEDLLREFGQDEQTETTTAQETVNKPYVEEKEVQYESLENEPVVYESLEEQSVNWDEAIQSPNKYQKALDEGMIKIDDQRVQNDIGIERNKHFEEFKIERKQSALASDIKKNLRSPGSVKKAIVLSEILKTKF